jgi:hypothetical protein
LQTSLSEIDRHVRAARRESDIAAIAVLERRLLRAHRASFPSPRPPTPVSTGDVEAQLASEALADLGWWQWRKRRGAQALAATRAPLVAAERHRIATVRYAAMKDGNPTAVMEALESTFEGNARPAAPIDCQDDSAAVLLLFDPVAAVPARTPSLTPSGRLTLQERTETKRHRLYIAALASTVLATVKETLATCPTLRSVRVLVVRRDPDDSDPEHSEPDDSDRPGDLVAIYAAEFPLQWVNHTDWFRINPVDEILNTPGALLSRAGDVEEVVALSLDGEPEIDAVIADLRRTL